MELLNNIKKEQWNEFVSTQDKSQFLQSWEWGELQPVDTIMRLAVSDGGELAAVIFIIKKSLPLGLGYFYSPRGPIVRQTKTLNDQEAIDFLFKEINILARRHKAMCLRFEPLEKIPATNWPIQRTINIQPNKTMILDLTQTEEEISAAMHQKTRYNIKLAKKRGVKIIAGEKKDFEDLWQLMQTTAARDGFRLHDKNHYYKLVSDKNSLVKTLLAVYDSKIIAGNIVSLFGDTATYMHGASAGEHRDVMAPYALQWETIKMAKALGCRYYDFYGIDSARWPGVTRFKKGFGGQEVTYPGTYDAIFDKLKYDIYKILRFIRRKI